MWRVFLRLAGLSLLAWFVVCGASHAQSLRMGYTRPMGLQTPWYNDFGYDPAYTADFNNRLTHREQWNADKEKAQKDSTFNLGPLSSTVYFTQSVGYRNVRTSGPGAAYLMTNGYGQVVKDGSDFPLVSTLSMNNDVPISEYMDLSATIQLRYACYPMKTQQDQFDASLMAEGSELRLKIDVTPFIRMVVYDSFQYRTDYVNDRGMYDTYGGRAYTYIRNTLGATTEWQMAKDKQLILDVNRSDIIPMDTVDEQLREINYGETLSYKQQILPELTGGASVGLSDAEFPNVTNATTWFQEDYMVFAEVQRRESDRIRARILDFTKIQAGVGYSTGHDLDKPVGLALPGEMQGPGGSNGTVIGYIDVETQLRPDLVQNANVSRRMRAGQPGTHEIDTEYGYVLNWRGDASGLSVGTQWTDVEMGDTRYPGYIYWMNRARYWYSATDRITPFLSCSYATTRNKKTPQDSAVALSLEDQWDYDVWSVTAGVSFEVFQMFGRPVYFSISGDHSERVSSEPLLTFAQDTLLATLTYGYRF